MSNALPCLQLSAATPTIKQTLPVCMAGTKWGCQYDTIAATINTPQNFRIEFSVRGLKSNVRIVSISLIDESRCSFPLSTRQLGIEAPEVGDFLQFFCLSRQTYQAWKDDSDVHTWANGACPEDSLLSLTQTRKNTSLHYNLLSINSSRRAIWTLTGQFIPSSLESFVVIL